MKTLTLKEAGIIYSELIKLGFRYISPNEKRYGPNYSCAEIFKSCSINDLSYDTYLYIINNKQDLLAHHGQSFVDIIRKSDHTKRHFELIDERVEVSIHLRIKYITIEHYLRFEEIRDPGYSRRYHTCQKVLSRFNIDDGDCDYCCNEEDTIKLDELTDFIKTKTIDNKNYLELLNNTYQWIW